jgi:hypothetical protein
MQCHSCYFGFQQEERIWVNAASISQLIDFGEIKETNMPRWIEIKRSSVLSLLNHRCKMNDTHIILYDKHVSSKSCTFGVIWADWFFFRR